MSVQYKTVQCLQLKYIPRKETSKKDAYGHLFLFSIVAGNAKYLKSACSQNWEGRRWSTKDLEGQQTHFSQETAYLLKYHNKNPTLNTLKPKSFDSISKYSD